MDTTPPSHWSEPRLPSKSASRLARMEDFDTKENDSLDDSPIKKIPSSPFSKEPKNLPLKELLLLSPSPKRRSKTRLIDRPEMAEEPVDIVVPRRRCKNRASPMGLMGCASPKINRRSRRRIDQDSREEKELTLGEEIVKPRKRRQPARPRKEKLSLVLSVPSSSSSPKTCNNDQSSIEHIGQLIYDMIMWKDVSKSTLWFGFGSLCFLSSCFTNGLRWSIFSMISQIGLIFLAVSFFYNTFSKRNKDEPKLDIKLKEDDIVRLARIFLPATNLVITKLTEIFSGDPSTTLKLAPFLLFGAEYGHLITLWRLCALGFFTSFTVPRLYSCYSVQINKKAEYLRSRVCEAWGACSHKKFVAFTAATVFWNLSSVKTRIFTAFISTVILRYNRQKSEEEIVEVGMEGAQTELLYNHQKSETEIVEVGMEGAQTELQQPLVVVGDVSTAKQI
ncbi:Reticulon-like protein b17 [Thalictrum thalictroides]|uniref:Reticulon-like protein n=1 Tax=Thalictrum thalictroides TaxID=46969 RepID=A0A7J6WPR3_THATH|nr:Reticulon-like protein b17 [Thalictrum thalictroides]